MDGVHIQETVCFDATVAFPSPWALRFVRQAVGGACVWHSPMGGCTAAHVPVHVDVFCPGAHHRARRCVVHPFEASPCAVLVSRTAHGCVSGRGAVSRAGGVTPPPPPNWDHRPTHSVLVLHTSTKRVELPMEATGVAVTRVQWAGRSIRSAPFGGTGGGGGYPSQCHGEHVTPGVCEADSDSHCHCDRECHARSAHAVRTQCKVLDVGKYSNLSVFGIVQWYHLWP